MQLTCSHHYGRPMSSGHMATLQRRRGAAGTEAHRSAPWLGGRRAGGSGGGSGGAGPSGAGHGQLICGDGGDSADAAGCSQLSTHRSVQRSSALHTGLSRDCTAIAFLHLQSAHSMTQFRRRLSSRTRNSSPTNVGAQPAHV